MSARNVALRVPAWRSFVWAGVVGSVLAWSLAWFVGRGAQAFMLVVALATVLFAYKAMSGMRVAFIGLMVAGFAMFLASIYWMFAVMMPSASMSAFEVLTLSVLPMVTAAVLLVGAAAGFRHSRDA